MIPVPTYSTVWYVVLTVHGEFLQGSLYSIYCTVPVRCTYLYTHEKSIFHKMLRHWGRGTRLRRCGHTDAV